MRTLWWSVPALMALVACAGPSDDDDDGLNPYGDEDGDGFTNGEEEDMGSDPEDASDVPYAGGWVKDASCRDEVESTGNGIGEVAEDIVLKDQYGEDFRLHDFCNTVVLVEFGAFT